MSDVLLLERIEETLAERPAVPQATRGSDLDDLESRVASTLKKSEAWLDSLENWQTQLRQLDGYSEAVAELWSDIEKRLSEIIQDREDLIRKGRPKTSDNPRLREMKAKVAAQLEKERNAVVHLYYLFKADADEGAEDTRGTGELLASADDIDAFFDRVRTAK